MPNYHSTRILGDFNVTGDTKLVNIVSTGTLTIPSIIENGTALSSKYLGIGATAANANLLDNLDSTVFVRADTADTIAGVLTFNAIPVFNGGTSGATAPFTVDSTTLVSNLNAEYLNGQLGSYYLAYANFTGVPTSLKNPYALTIGGGLTGTSYDGSAAVTIAHADTSSQASVDNSARTYIQDITLDTYGHVTGLVSATETVTDTHYASKNIVGASSSATADAAATDDNVWLNHIENGAVTSNHNLKSGTGLSITSDASGDVTFTNTAPDVNHNTITNLSVGTVTAINVPVLSSDGSDISTLPAATALLAGIVINGTQAFGGSKSISHTMQAGTTAAFTTPHLALVPTDTVDNTGFIGMTFGTSTSPNYGYSVGALRSTNGGGDFVIRNHNSSATGVEVFRLDASGNLTVPGKMTVLETEVSSISNGVLFEGSAADDFEGLLKAGTLTADRTYTLPDKTGTVAMTSDIPTSDNYSSWTLQALNISGTSLGTSIVTSGDTAVFKAGTGITLAWADDQITITNASPDVNHNTDTLVTQTLDATSTGIYPVLASASVTTTATETTTSKKIDAVNIQPSSGTLTATVFKTGSWTIVQDDTSGSLTFNYS